MNLSVKYLLKTAMITTVAVSINFYCLTKAVQHFSLQNSVQIGPLLKEHETMYIYGGRVEPAE